ncbi:ribonuclease D [Mycolicibacterium mageritense DSM 44476 = CIP 104973]|uniref:Ribonuclease D n=2 Tax=Mycolicibacterium TaxID=1866885 RepID=A0AAI8TYT9_MYCME|nr:ribonuclease D [Mycolicibacterium mageritense]MBN3458703.1 ribonuclease D [Mycobacterium sp. DSM 3803]TXI62814.1 MAG: ribonuclease D [Mycolicibacterium mageritense]CDO24654.1 ribonuclease D [Mycolicibacterium mageritense DSM 44476 = CIP 104973]BBX36550.1 ribonuclease D [Mycolicibacterium mageritense]BDY31354.1 Ribonuclease D [Mycolicibacterium mageritense]
MTDGDPEHTDLPDVEATPLLTPADGVPEVCVSSEEISSAATLLAAGTGPFAIDAERASGFRYSNRAYLVQIRRSGSGTALIDPVNHGGSPIDAMAPVAEALATDEWVLHAADQDLPCLAEIGLRPTKLYDTELAGRLAGFERVNLAAMVQRLLGLQLMKGHGAADWSKRPLPHDWLNYAALDVEVLLELRDAIAAVLEEQGKTDWAAQEFEYLRTYVAQPTRRDRWRRTSGIHKVRNPRALAAVRELWTTRDNIARSRDIAPGRILPDAAIVNAASVDPKTVEELTALPIFGGSKQRRSAQVWLDALKRARDNPDPPESAEPLNGPPPAARWARRKPEAAARLEAAKGALVELSQRVSVPTENLLTPELVRRLCWDWQPVSDVATAIEEFLAEAGARPWQRELAVPVLTEALRGAPDE